MISVAAFDDTQYCPCSVDAAGINRKPRRNVRCQASIGPDVALVDVSAAFNFEFMCLRVKIFLFKCT